MEITQLNKEVRKMLRPVRIKSAIYATVMTPVSLILLPFVFLYGVWKGNYDGYYAKTNKYRE